MSGLFDSLTSASNSLIAQRMGLDVVGQNMANINTPGYTRRVLDLSEVPATDPLNAGRGVTVDAVRAMRDQLVEARLRREQGDTSRDTAMSEIVSTVEGAIGMPGQSLDADLSALFAAFAALTQDPTSAVARDTVVREAQSVAATFTRLSGQFTQIQADADRAIRSAATDVNAITAEIAKLNRDISAASYDVESIRDRQTQLLAELGNLTDIQVQQGPDGAINVTLSSGHALVIGGNSYALTQSASGLTTLSIDGANVTSAITGGRIGGLLQARDTTIPSYLARLDQIAFDLAGAVNAIHLTGFDGNGAPAGNFFTPLAGVPGSAMALAVDPAVVADSALVAASATGAAGDNAIALQLASLRDGLVSQGGTRTLVASWSQLTYAVGSDAAAARAATRSHNQVVTQLQQLRAETSGVSYDEEAAHLMRYQRAYEANARYFQTILDTLDSLMEMVR